MSSSITLLDRNTSTGPPDDDVRVKTADASVPDATLSTPRAWCLAIGLCLGLFLSMLDSSIVATSLFSIGTEFNDLERINWVALAYTLAYVGCAALFARISDVVGRRNAFLAGFTIFFAFSLGCGFSQNLDTLIACRALQGIGGSGLYSVTMIALPESTPNHMRSWLAAMVGLVITTAGTLGPVLGGVLTHAASWRWVFWINGPIGVVSMALFWISWPKPEYLPKLPDRSWKDLDFIGSFLLVAAAVLTVFAFQNAGESKTNPWSSTTFIAPLVAGGICWVALFAWEYYLETHQPHKMAALPLVLFRNHVFAFGILGTLFTGFPFLATLFAIPVRLQVVNGETSLIAGIMLLPMLISGGIGSALSGALNKRTNRLFESTMAAAFFIMLGCALETTVSDSQILEPKLLGFSAFIGFGFGITAASVTMLTNIEAPAHEMAPAQGVIAQARVLGGSIGIAMSSAILAAQQKSQLGGGEISLSHGDDLLYASPEYTSLLRQTYSDWFHEVMVVCAIVSGVAVLIALGTWRRNRVDMDTQREAQAAFEKARRETLADSAGVLSV